MTKVVLRSQAKPEQQEPLHVALRPSTLEQVVGHDLVVKSIRNLLSQASGRLPQSYLFTGPSGVGKTTLARILAKMLGVSNVYLIDAATHSGVDTMRGITDLARYPSLGESPRKMYIVDECHALSSATWKSMLVALEEPPPHTFWALCTTEPDKVPATIRTRCHMYDLKPVKWDTICEYLATVCETYSYQTDAALLGIISRKANGSVRQALVYLSMVQDLSAAEATKLLEEFSDAEGDAAQLARLLVTGKATWETVQPVLQAMQEVSAESVRLNVIGYVNKVLADEKKPERAATLINILNAFSVPCNPSEKQAPLFLAVARVIFN